jgi:hypothetical protein
MAAIASRLYTRRRMLRIALLALTLICCTASAAEIRVWHSMSGVRGTEFQRLVARFNASQKQFRVVATYKGAYDEAVWKRLPRGARRAHRIWCRLPSWAPRSFWSRKTWRGRYGRLQPIPGQR